MSVQDLWKTERDPAPGWSYAAGARLRRSPYCLRRLWIAKGGALAIRELCGNVFSGQCQAAILFTLLGASDLRKQSENWRSGKRLWGFASH
jgi:hypothetical protein